MPEIHTRRWILQLEDQVQLHGDEQGFAERQMITQIAPSHNAPIVVLRFVHHDEYAWISLIVAVHLTFVLYNTHGCSLWFGGNVTSWALWHAVTAWRVHDVVHQVNERAFLVVWKRSAEYEITIYYIYICINNIYIYIHNISLLKVSTTLLFCWWNFWKFFFLHLLP